MFITLVDELATGVFPAAIMAVTCCGVASFVAYRLGSSFIMVVAVTGTIVGGPKCLIKHRHQRALRDRSWTRPRASRWERVHAGFTLGSAAHIGYAAARGFLAADPALPNLVTGLVFGYCSGTVTRISFRPLVAGIAISIATVPGIVASVIWGDATSRGIATAPPGSLELDPLMAAADAELDRTKEGNGGGAVRRAARSAVDPQPTLRLEAAS